MKKLISLTSLLLAVLFVLTGCNVTGPSDTETTTAEPTAPAVTDPPAPTELVLAENGATEYKIIRAMKAGATVIDAMQALRAKIKNLYSTDIVPAEDFVKGYSAENPYESADPEILIGNTNRKESQEVLATLEKGEWRICVVGNKLVMIGYTDILTETAVKEFVKAQVKDRGEKLSVPTDFELSGKIEYTAVGDTDASLRVMTFNVLADSTASERATVIADTVSNYEPDVVCFQECNSTHHKNALMLLKKHNYKVALEKHPGTSTYIYTPIVYRTDRLELLDSGVEWNEKRWPYTNTKSIAWAVFRHLETQEVFSVINVHGSLWSTGYDPAKMGEGMTHAQLSAESPYWRQDNVRQMNVRMKELEKTYGEIPSIWTGDFNFNENEIGYKDTVNVYGMSAAEKTATVSKMTGATYHGGIGKAPDSKGKSIDHIFGNNKVIFRVHYICKSDSEIKASDHCAVFADLKFEK